MWRLSVLAALLSLVAVPASQGWIPSRYPRRAIRMEATAYSRAVKPTAAGTVAHEGTAAADPAVLPLGSRIRVRNAGEWSGIYTITDTGNKVVGRHIDLYVPSTSEARRFGKRVVIVQLLQTGLGARDAREKDIPANPAP